MTGIVHVGASVAEVGSLWVVFLCRVSGLRGVAFAGVLGLAGEECGVKVEVWYLEGRAVRLVLAGRALSRYL